MDHVIGGPVKSGSSVTELRLSAVALEHPLHKGQDSAVLEQEPELTSSVPKMWRDNYPVSSGVLVGQKLVWQCPPVELNPRIVPQAPQTSISRAISRVISLHKFRYLLLLTYWTRYGRSCRILILSEASCASFPTAWHHSLFPCMILTYTNEVPPQQNLGWWTSTLCLCNSHRLPVKRYPEAGHSHFFPFCCLFPLKPNVSYLP